MRPSILRLPVPRQLASVVSASFLTVTLAACHGSSNVGDADALANKLSSAGIACASPDHQSLTPPETSNAYCEDALTTGTAADIHVYSSHDEALSAYRVRCQEGSPGGKTVNGGVEHFFLGGNWFIRTGGVAGVDDVGQAVGRIEDTDCQHTS
jgi:hypothetical protein